MNKYFRNILKRQSIISIILKLIPIPVGIITAKLMADVVNAAVAGNISDVLVGASTLLIIIVLTKLLTVFTEIVFQKSVSKATHKCKMLLYRQFLSNPLYILYNAEHGKSIEKLNDDFDKVIDKNLSVYPNFWIGIITTIAYFLFIALQSFIIAISLLGISLLQLIPPMVIKKYMQINYDKTREIEAEVTDYVVASYNGLATIKLYDLKKWYLEKLKVLHKEYLKIGSASEVTAASQNAMEALLENILKGGTYGIIGAIVLFGYSSLDVGIKAIALSGGFFVAVKTIFNSIPNFSVAKMAEKRLDEWFSSDNIIKSALKGSKISLSNVCYSYDENEILNGATVSFDLSKTNILKGANGIGKSTLFKLITGLSLCDDGEIKIGDISPQDIEESQWNNKLFYLPQEDVDFAITPVELFSMIIPNKIQDCRQIASDFGLTEDIINEFKITTLSGGERKKVFLSLAFALKPTILLLDEPTNSLDLSAKKMLCNKLEQREGGAIIITHDDVLDVVADNIYIIQNGGVYCE
ncbi:MAG: ABC transporter ATP-binding protein/permease [Xylanivirga thermophila]|jgi:ATP-binding cassette, subfamily B, bacterial|uniref:ATP-binding cassette domain-containing protein n=1 Tax=Xylanivirga thermophila TaxID=2496273 RepID=UPI0039F61354